MSEIREKARQAKDASRLMARASTGQKNAALQAVARRLRQAKTEVLEANRRDLARAELAGLPKPMLKRLTLDETKIEAMAKNAETVGALPDPVGEYIAQWRRPNGLTIGQVRVPFGVVGIIYESRPNVTLEAASLCMKTGNAALLRGGSEALGSNVAIVDILQAGLQEAGLPQAAVSIVNDPERKLALEMMRCNEYLDVLIPRGGAGLIRSVVENSTVPVIETGVGNCHVYVHREADLRRAVDIVVNAKCSNPSVCNAAETLLVDEAVASVFLPDVAQALTANGVELRGCPKARAVIPGIKEAAEEDWAAEYLDLVLAVKVVGGPDEAIAHINRWGTRHSEAILTDSYAVARRFADEVDAAAVYVNASTRFTDGFEFGFGAEVGISTQKLHARGPMGLKELTTYKFIVQGDGQIRV